MNNGRHRIALIELDYNHNELISMLKIRGSAMKNKNTKKKDKIEQEIKLYLQDHKQILERPISAFVTFEYTEAVN